MIFAVKNLNNNFKKSYHKFLSTFSGFKPALNKVEIDDFSVNFNEGVLETPLPALNKLSDTYVLIRKLFFNSEVKMNTMQHFTSLLKWKELNLQCSTALRDYPLGFSADVNEINYPEIHLSEDIKMQEEIVQVLPYVRKIQAKRLFGVPFIKKPVYKSYFSKEEMKSIREKVAEQNKTGWLNIEIFEVYDKFHYNFFFSVKQIQGSKELECYPNPECRDKTPKTVAYLIIGRKRDTGEPIKAIINPADIKKGK